MKMTTEASETSFRRRTVSGLLVAVATLAALLAVPAPAQAGTVAVTVTIRGAGTVSSVEGGPLSCSLTNGYNDNAESSCPRQTFEAPFEAWVWLRPQPADFPSGDSEWRFSHWEGCNQTRPAAGTTECAVHSGAFTSDERYPKAFFYDSRNPDVAINSGPTEGSRVTSKSAAFTFSSTDPWATFRCKLDAAPAYSACVSGVSYSGLSEGTHTFRVYAVDPSGNAAPVDAVRTWTVDSVAPSVTITSGPAAGVRTSATGATFTFQASEPSQFWCKLDNGGVAPCSGSGARFGSSPTYFMLGDGTHTFSVYANDGLQAGPVVSRTWTVDTTAPDTVVDGPSGVISDSTPTFSFASVPADDGSTFQCRLDGGAWGACSGPGNTHTPSALADGPHTFDVRASDSLGNVDSTPATRAFEVRTPVVITPPPPPTVTPTPPDTVITRGPSGRTRDRTPTFKFTADMQGSTFVCKLDRGRYRACSSPWTIKRLSYGKHTVTIRATNAGLADPTPAVRKFKLVRRG